MRIGSVALGVLAVTTWATGSLTAQKEPVASPRDSVKATIGGATIEVNYGRPSMRGRLVAGVGGLIPYDEVWRTGADRKSVV